MGVKTALNRAAVETAAATHTYFQPIETREAVPTKPLQKVRYQVQKVARETDGPTAGTIPGIPIAEISADKATAY